jgi:hypothetical protein
MPVRGELPGLSVVVHRHTHLMRKPGDDDANRVVLTARNHWDDETSQETGLLTGRTRRAALNIGAGHQLAQQYRQELAAALRDQTARQAQLKTREALRVVVACQARRSLHYQTLGRLQEACLHRDDVRPHCSRLDVYLLWGSASADIVSCRRSARVQDRRSEQGHRRGWVYSLGFPSAHNQTGCCRFRLRGDAHVGNFKGADGFSKLTPQATQAALRAEAAAQSARAYMDRLKDPAMTTVFRTGGIIDQVKLCMSGARVFPFPLHDRM